MRIVLSLAALIFFLIASSAQAGTVASTLQEKLASVSAEEQVSVLIQMADRVDMKSLNLGLQARKAKLKERHKVVLESLKLKAEKSQKDIVSYLTLAKNQGRIEDFRTFWIANLIWVKSPRSEIEALALRIDVESIHLTPKVELVTPVSFNVIDQQAEVAAFSIGIKAVKAPQVWALGYKGKGRIVCNIDTGVDRLHPTLSSRWRGLFVPVNKRAETWFDPVYGTTQPNDNKAGINSGHGTFTMGITTGFSSTDTIGVAPEAHWIAAQAIDIGAGWPVEIAALQWAADPDGDISTLDDVPDVVNNSWGVPKYLPSDPSTCGSPCSILPAWEDCWELYYQVVDNLAAAGPVVVFAAGNEGWCGGGVSNLRTPSDKITSEFNVFSVGSVNASTPADTANPPISCFSSRGPAYCNPTVKKPEVVAPGENVRSAFPGNMFAVGSGTSFSAPHVAGAAALLKQINPNATSDQILRALFVTAKDLGTAGEDNSYGRGFINILAAIDSLPPLSQPHIYVSEYEFFGDANGQAEPGENITLNTTLINDGQNAFGVRITLSSTSSLATVTADSVSFFGDINQHDTVFNASLDFTTFSVSSSALPGEKLPFTLKITDDSGYLASYPLLFYVVAKPLAGKANHTKGNFTFTISNLGHYGFAVGTLNDGTFAPDTGLGFKYPKVSGVNHLFEGAALFGIPTTQVSDAARDYVGYAPDNDFAVGPGGDLVMDSLSANRLSDQDGFGCFTDEKAENPIGLKITQRSYVFSDTVNDDYVIIEYTIHNQTGSTITGLRPGFFTDWDFPWNSGGSDRAAFIRSLNMGYMYEFAGSRYRGLVITDTLGVTSFRAIENNAWIYDGFTDGEKWAFMSGGFVDTTNITNTDGSMLIASGPFDIPAGDSVKTSLAIVAATSLANLQTLAQRAITKYQTSIMCVAMPGDVNASGGITLGDIIHLVNYYFDKDGPGCLGSSPGNCWTPVPFCRGDVNSSGTITLGDVIHLVNYYFDKDGPGCLGSDPGSCWTPVISGVCCQPVP